MAHVCNPSTGETGRRIQSSSQPVQHSEILSQKDGWLEREKENLKHKIDFEDSLGM